MFLGDLHSEIKPHDQQHQNEYVGPTAPNGQPLLMNEGSAATEDCRGSCSHQQASRHYNDGTTCRHNGDSILIISTYNETQQDPGLYS